MCCWQLWLVLVRTLANRWNRVKINLPHEMISIQIRDAKVMEVMVHIHPILTHASSVWTKVASSNIFPMVLRQNYVLRLVFRLSRRIWLGVLRHQMTNEFLKKPEYFENVLDSNSRAKINPRRLMGDIKHQVGHKNDTRRSTEASQEKVKLLEEDRP